MSVKADANLRGDVGEEECLIHSVLTYGLVFSNSGVIVGQTCDIIASAAGTLRDRDG
jgi:hypothetical protein